MTSKEQNQEVVNGSCPEFSIHGDMLSVNLAPGSFEILFQGKINASLLPCFLGLLRILIGEALVEHLTNISVHFRFVVLEQYGSHWVIDIEWIE
jgi:uncharacterized membrane protein YjjP (DUF1212 family)